VVAIAQNGVIGRDNGLPWRLKTDLKRFRDLTWGRPMIMGRRTWDSIGRPLPGRASVVLTRQAGWTATGATVVRDWEEARAVAADLARQMGTAAAAVIGGAALFRLALPGVDTIHLTRVQASPPGDVAFPGFDESLFDETFREEHPAGDDDEYPFTFIDLVRARSRKSGHVDAAGR